MQDHASVAFESLEPRMLLSVAIELDYSLDAQGFFLDPARREVMEAAVDYLSSLIDDSFTAIVPGGGNDWRIRLIDPATGESAEIDNPTIDEDELLVFVGGRSLEGTTLGQGGAGGWEASGSSAFLLNVEGRGQSGATGPEDGQTDTSLWGGSITFDIDTNWHFGLTSEGLEPAEHDFYSVALHELIHVLGFSDATPAFANLISPSGEFMGAASMAVSGDTSLQAGDFGHWDDGLQSAGQETLMDPTFVRGTRKLVTPLDFAAMEDIGWEMNPQRWPGLGSFVALSPFTGNGMDSGATAPTEPGLHWVDPRQAGLLDFRVLSDEPVSLRLWDSRGLLVEETTMSDTVIGLAISASDQFYSIEVVTNSAPTTYDLAVSSGGFLESAYYPEGFASQDVDQAVTISNPTDSAQLYTLVLRYERGDLGRDADVVAFERIIEPGSVQRVDIARSGVLATDEPSGRSILGSQPYALVLESTGPLGATLEHEDEFGEQDISTAESFTREQHSEWTFAGAQKAAGIFDFLVFYNPNDHDVLVTMTFQNFTSEVRLTQEVRAGARGGLNLQDTAALPDGRFGVVVQSEALDVADQPDHRGIVAALTHFDGNAGSGWTTLGVHDPLPAAGMIPLADVPGSTVQANIFNPGSSTITLQLVRFTPTGQEAQTDRFVPAGTAASIPVPEGIGYGYTFVGGRGVIQFVQSGMGREASAGQLFDAGTRLAFSIDDYDDGPSSRLRLTASNDSSSSVSVSVRFFFGAGTEITQSFMISGMDFQTLDIDAITAVGDRTGEGPLAVVLESSAPITALLALIDGDDDWSSAGMVLPT